MMLTCERNSQENFPWNSVARCLLILWKRLFWWSRADRSWTAEDVNVTEANKRFINFLKWILNMYSLIWFSWKAERVGKIWSGKKPAYLLGHSLNSYSYLWLGSKLGTRNSNPVSEMSVMDRQLELSSCASQDRKLESRIEPVFKHRYWKSQPAS